MEEVGEGVIRLSARQHDVLLLIARGHTDSEIAARLGIAPRTVRQHCDALKVKFNVRRRRELLRFVHALDSAA
jgi:DNA-binding CsgD family transcriptional regulator